ncbi:hypothetical protein B1694_05465 [Geobacillus zalihae]|nr:hypothetical protein B1693_12490 [Geobacillus zalihae]OQP24097.1 hypothetical protein B1694_05465 [Geobacillus zalihae]
MESIERHYKWRKKEKRSLHDQSGDARTEVTSLFPRPNRTLPLYKQFLAAVPNESSTTAVSIKQKMCQKAPCALEGR